MYIIRTYVVNNAHMYIRKTLGHFNDIYCTSCLIAICKVILHLIVQDMFFYIFFSFYEKLDVYVPLSFLSMTSFISALFQSYIRRFSLIKTRTIQIRYFHLPLLLYLPFFPFLFLNILLYFSLLFSRSLLLSLLFSPSISFFLPFYPFLSSAYKRKLFLSRRHVINII